MWPEHLYMCTYGIYSTTYSYLYLCMEFTVQHMHPYIFEPLEVGQAIRLF
jgi:hypothetical protein